MLRAAWSRTHQLPSAALAVCSSHLGALCVTPSLAATGQTPPSTWHRGFAAGAKAAAAKPPRATGGAAAAAEVVEAPDAARLPIPTASTDSLWQLSPPDVGKFFRLSQQDAARLLPEGCPALAAEFEASGTRELLVRDAWLRARARVFPQAAADSASPPPPAFSSTLVLDGPSGAGKSVLLALLVAAARDAGWVALYVPQGRALTGGSLFFQHEGVTPPMWDTPGHAAQLLTALWAAHGSVLQGLPQRRPGVLGGLTLGQLHAAGTSQSATPVAAVDALLAMVQELRLVSEVPTMVAIDELNALWGWTEYHQTTGPRSRKRLHAGQLRVAATLRAFDSTPGPARGVLLGATSATAGISPKVHVANLPKGARAAVPRFSLQETGAMVAMYAAAGRITSLAVGGENEPDEQAAGVQQAARKLHALTVGSGADLRDILPLV